MQALPFVSLLFYIIIIVCKASAECPCHIPCTGEREICTCFGPCGDDGYGCKSNDENYDFLGQIQCAEGQWQVQCIREATCAEGETLDDTNPYAAYELEAQKNNILQDSFDDDDDTISSAHSFSWFGGNWFDFWGQNDAQFFNEENMKTIKATNKYDNNDDITIDNQDWEDPSLVQSQSAQRTLQTSQSKYSSKPILDDLGRNEAGYKIIALPLYILIICIVSSAILGMLMCAGFVYCGLHCCCPLPPSSPMLTSAQRSNTIEMSRVLQSLTLGGGYKQRYDSGSGGHNIYHRMRNALHNPTNDEASIDSDDEYVDSEDENDQKIDITRGNIEDNQNDYDFKIEEKETQSFALIGKCQSDIDNDSDDSMIRQLGNLVETRLLNQENYNNHSNNEEQYEEKEQEEEEEEESDDDDDIDNEPEIEDTENEGAPLINVNGNIDSGNNSGSKSSNLP